MANQLQDMLERHELYELLPTHGKVVTLDADLPMKHALAALASHAATCLPVWDSAQQRFVDVFSCSDLVDIVLYTHRAFAASGSGGAIATGGDGSGRGGEAQHALERCQLRDLHGLKRTKPSGFVMASVDDSIYHGSLMLKQHRLECLPLGDTACSSSLLHLLLPEQVLAFIASSAEFREGTCPIFAASLGEMVLPNCPALRTVARNNATLADALSLLSAERLAAVPVVEANGTLCDVISGRDVRQLASMTLTNDLGVRLEDSLRALPPTPLRVHSAALQESLATAISRLANADVAQLILIDETGSVRGVATASTVLASVLPFVQLS